MAGLFLSFEGIDGCGKSTQADLCFRSLQEMNIPAVKTREPGGEPVAEKIREILLYSKDEIAHSTEVLLYAASRAQHVARVIRPSLEAGKVVVCDRFVHSSLAYQGYGLGIDIDAIWNINHFAMGGTFPDLVFLFDIDLEEARSRSKARENSSGREISSNNEINNREDRIEKRDLVFYRKVRQGFLELAKNDSRIIVLDGREPIDILHGKVMKAVTRALNV